MADPTATVEAPPRTARVGGISSVTGPFRPNSRLPVSTGLQYPADVCSLAVGDIQLCYGPDVDAEDKTGDGLDWGTSIVPVFGGYVGVECWLGTGADEYGPRAQRQLEASQDRVIEAALHAWMATATDTVASATLELAVAAADNHADENYIGRPILHVNRGDAVALREAGALRGGGDEPLVTANGSPVVASFAYDAGVVYTTGGIGVDASPVVVREGRDLTHNRMMAIAERTFGLTVDCDYVAMFTVTP